MGLEVETRLILPISFRAYVHHAPSNREDRHDHKRLSLRRRFIKISITGLAAAPESDPIAASLDCKMHATKARNRKDSAAVCPACSLYSGKPSVSDGPCSLFGGKLVNAKGWCTAWTKKA